MAYFVYKLDPMCLIESRSQIWRVRLATEKVHWSNITNCKEPRAPTESSRNYTRSQSTNAKEILETTTVKHDTYHKATQTPSICKEFLSVTADPFPILSILILLLQFISRFILVVEILVKEKFESGYIFKILLIHIWWCKSFFFGSDNSVFTHLKSSVPIYYVKGCGFKP